LIATVSLADQMIYIKISCDFQKTAGGGDGILEENRNMPHLRVEDPGALTGRLNFRKLCLTQGKPIPDGRWSTLFRQGGVKMDPIIIRSFERILDAVIGGISIYLG
jgi:hypothetical protein